MRKCLNAAWSLLWPLFGGYCRAILFWQRIYPILICVFQESPQSWYLLAFYGDFVGKFFAMLVAADRNAISGIAINRKPLDRPTALWFVNHISRTHKIRLKSGVHPIIVRLESLDLHNVHAARVFIAKIRR